jgi:dihydrodiol dehydrogenase / D-xylose 1-dehydrogenase (NADP)
LEYVEKTIDIEGQGMYWEADECARCIRESKLESEYLSLQESLVMMEVMDDVRKQNGLSYPENVESIKYPLGGF